MVINSRLDYCECNSSYPHKKNNISEQVINGDEQG